MRKTVVASVLVLVILLGSFFYLNYQMNSGRIGAGENRPFEIIQGEGVTIVGKKLEEEKLIKNDLYFDLYIWLQGLKGNKVVLLPGKYDISPNLSIPEIVYIMSHGKEKPTRITFAEGLRSVDMAEKVTEKGRDGGAFLKLAKTPDNFSGEFPFLKDKNVKSLEGFLFPDTYDFSPKDNEQDMIVKILRNFDRKFDSPMRAQAQSQDHSIFEIITMASLIEKEARINYQDQSGYVDAQIVSGIFWKRVAEERTLQSCATLAYILGVDKKQYSYEDTQIQNPFNTYLNKGLPPGPISNPGLLAIQAALNPKTTEFNYFLSDPKTGKMVFSRTIDEHNANKVKYGL
jgi:UPF0755 protein